MQKKRKMICSKCRNTSFEVYQFEVVNEQTQETIKPFPVYSTYISFQCTNCGLINCTEGLIM